MNPAAATVHFRFYEELNDFLAPAQRWREFAQACPPGATVKHMVEALGVPHTEVELLLLNGESVGFEHRLCEGDRVAVYPTFEALDITPLLRVREQPLRCNRFIADSHLGGLARLLRLCGFDTLFDNHYADAEMVRIALAERRIVLTRDRELLKRRELSHGCFVRALRPQAQLRELIERLDLGRAARPFTRCLVCNALLRAASPAEIASAAPPFVRERQRRFAACSGCGRLYWEGSHWRRMRALLEGLPLRAPP